MKRDRETVGEGGWARVPLNDWDRPGRAQREGRERCYGRKDKWKTIDVSELEDRGKSQGREV